MKIAILGSGKIGGTLGKLWCKKGHNVFFSSRHPQNLQPLVAEAGPNAQLGTPQEALAFSDVILLAVPWRTRNELPPAKLFAAKIVIDSMNPYAEPGKTQDLGDSTSSEEVAKQLPGARMVKAFNTLYFETLGSVDTRLGKKPYVIFVAGDDVEAKAVAFQLIQDTGFIPYDVGSLREGGSLLQPGSPFYAKAMTEEKAREALSKVRKE